MAHPVRIASCSGSASDRRDALETITSNHPSDPVDIIIGDWMSEFNMTTRGSSKASTNTTTSTSVPSYEPSFLESVAPAIQNISANGQKLIVNAGASDTPALHSAVQDLAYSKGIQNLNIAYITGDEVLPQLLSLQKRGGKGEEFRNIYTNQRLDEWNFEPLYAQAYLGGMGIKTALDQGADIVLCGRVSDASLTVGAASWYHGWSIDKEEDMESLANALVAGHLIECSSYVTGGNFSGFRKFNSNNQNEGWDELGYPITEISSKGEVVMTKTKGSEGEMSVDTCTSQLLYEIQGPLYMNSDIVADISSISFQELGTSRVAFKGVRGLPPPPTTKVGITAHGGYQAEMSWYLTGLDIDSKADMLEQTIRGLLTKASPFKNMPYRDPLEHFTVLDFQLLGSSPENPKSQNASTCTLRIIAQSRRKEWLESRYFARPCTDGIMASYPGGQFNLDLRTATPREIYEYFVTLIPQEELQQMVHLPWTTRSNSFAKQMQPYAQIEKTTIPIPSPKNTTKYLSRQRSTIATTKSTTTSPSEEKLPDHRTLPKTKGGTTDAAAGWAELPALPGRRILREVFNTHGRTRRFPLGRIIHARSGDKSGDCNVGFFIPHSTTPSGKRVKLETRQRTEMYEWLDGFLTTERIKDLLGVEYRYRRGDQASSSSSGNTENNNDTPDTDQKIERHTLPSIFSLNFVLRNHLDRGVSCTRTVDYLGKNTAEYLRAKWVDVPVKFLGWVGESNVGGGGGGNRDGNSNNKKNNKNKRGLRAKL